MMLARTLRSLTLFLLGGLLTWAALNYRADSLTPDASPQAEDESPASPAPGAEQADAGPAVVLSRERQMQAGIVTTTLSASRRAPEATASALVIDLQPLLDLRERGQSLRAELQAARVEADVSRQALERLARLKRQEAASERRWQETQVQAAASQARLAAADSAWRALRADARLQWGETLSRQVVDPSDPAFEGLRSGAEKLLLVTLPAVGFSGAAPERIFVGRGDRASAQAARLVSAAPRSDVLLQGETFFYALPAAELRTAMRLDAWLPLAGDAETGVDAPREAIVWRAGRPWLYVQTGPERFERRAVVRYRDLGANWFIGAGSAAGETVVTQGAQSLLSEEFRGQIPDEDED